MSRNHFSIDMARGEVVVVERGSRLGNIANGKRINAQAVLNMGENEIIVGQKISHFFFKLEIR